MPPIRDTLRPLGSSAAGRKFLVQVPGSAQSKLSHAELAAVLNWMIDNLSASPKPQVRRFTATEVASYRRTPLVAVSAIRKRLLAELAAASQADPALKTE